jgi:glycosyltransferase involved in cell wall biosynthesis
MEAGVTHPRQANPTPRLAYVIGTYPVPTTTFIDREIEALRRLGAHVQVISIRRPPGAGLSERQLLLHAGVHYVLPVRAGDLLRSHLGFLVSRPGAYARTLIYVISRPHPSFGSRAKTVIHFVLGVHVARLIRERYPADHLHAHFVDRAALVALVAGRLLERSFSATAHANDIYVDPVLLPEKIASAKFIATCTRHNRAHLRSAVNGGSEGKVRCIYHGLDLSEYAPAPDPRRDRPLILSVGQLKRKKGFHHLLDACRILDDRGLSFDCQIVGDGPLRGELTSRIGELDLRSRVRLLGALPHEAVVEKYREATIFALPCVTGPDGDRDGIPNVILEAMAMGVPVVSTRHSGIPEAVEDGRTGLLVSPGDPSQIATAIVRLLEDPSLRERLGSGGRDHVKEVFDIDANARALLAEVVA